MSEIRVDNLKSEDAVNPVGFSSGLYVGPSTGIGATITFVSNIPGQTRTIPLALYTLIQTPEGEAGAMRLVVLSIILALGALVLSEYLARRMRRLEGL